MDLTQNKLSKMEWGNIEIPVSDKEKKILETISRGFRHPDIHFNTNISLFQHIKIEYSQTIEYNLYVQYFEKDIKQMVDKFLRPAKEPISPHLHQILQFAPTIKSSLKTLKKADIIRLKNTESNIEKNKPNIFEFLLVDFCKTILKSIHEKNTTFIFYLYTLIQFKKSTIPQINQYVQQFVDRIIDYASNYTNIQTIVYHSYDFIEKNPYLIKYEDLTLFTHQKELFTIFQTQKEIPKLVLYTAPTGTGKTLSPLGLAQEYKVIFVCVARHVGLALAKSAISMGQKVAFAFGCETASDIRLHYFAASTYTKNRKSGGIGKVDNSIGDKVEIMICDVKSYLTAMHYMLAFNPETDIITYWDEPTITMDYEEHELHETIHRNWVENKISKLVLSCATLPKEIEIMTTINDFKMKFENAQIHIINSYDCKKTISLLNTENKCVLPHLMFRNYRDLLKCSTHCNENKTLLRYFDLVEIIRFIVFVNDTDMLEDDNYKVRSYFHSITDITMNSIKIYYLELLNHLDSSKWEQCYIYMTSTQPKKYDYPPNNDSMLRKIKSENATNIPSVKNNQITRMQSFAVQPTVDSLQPETVETKEQISGIRLTTSDAHTITDGPAIYLAENVEKMGQFYIQQSNIPDREFQTLMEKIEQNNAIQEKLEILEKNLEDKLGNEIEKEKKMEKEFITKETRALTERINQLRAGIRMIDMNSKYIPNRVEHQEIWNPEKRINIKAFTTRIEEANIKEIMMLGVSNDMKILLLLGIGIFKKEENNELRAASLQYMELMKKLAYDQKLFLIIASSDYIYGTNYQFCHGFIGDDLTNMTQQKTIQAMGRIGRNNVQNEYTIRFRSDEILMNLFSPMEYNLEAVNMSSLFCS